MWLGSLVASRDVAKAMWGSERATRRASSAAVEAGLAAEITAPMERMAR